jgi:hypothetical protein
MNTEPVRVAKKLDTATVLKIIAEEMKLWGQSNEKGAIGVVLGRILEAHRVAENGLKVNYPAWLVGGNKRRKRTKPATRS